MTKVPEGKVPQRDTKRDKALIADYRSGKFKTAEISGKYNISASRLYEILDFYKVKRNTKNKTGQK